MSYLIEKWKNVYVSCPLIGFTLVEKLRNFDFRSHSNKLIFFDKKIYVARFEYVQ